MASCVSVLFKWCTLCKYQSSMLPSQLSCYHRTVSVRGLCSCQVAHACPFVIKGVRQWQTVDSEAVTLRQHKWDTSARKAFSTCSHLCRCQAHSALN
jgi:hypothetical protein